MERIRELLLSTNKDDIELGFILSKEINISVLDFYNELVKIYENMKYPERMELKNKYLDFLNNNYKIQISWKTE